VFDELDALVIEHIENALDGLGIAGAVFQPTASSRTSVDTCTLISRCIRLW
jgi:hypothetical protein